MKFQAAVLLNGKTATGIEVPEAVVTALNAGKRPPVKVTIKGYTYRTTVAPYNGMNLIPLSAENRAGVGIAAGDQIEVEIVLDTEPRTVELPEDFSAALAADPEAKKYFEGLSLSNKRGIVQPILDAKTEDTRQRRIAKSVEKLHEGKI
jgi:hypothetical protein